MLVLTRKRSEVIKIGDDIYVTVISTSAGSVKLGIAAPSNIRVLRAELSNRPAPATEMEALPISKAGSQEDAVFSADRFPSSYSSDYVAELEDQVLLTLAK